MSKSGGVFQFPDDVKRTMSKRGGVLVNVFTPPPPFRKSCIRAWDMPFHHGIMVEKLYSKKGTSAALSVCSLP